MIKEVESYDRLVDTCGQRPVGHVGMVEYTRTARKNHVLKSVLPMEAMPQTTEHPPRKCPACHTAETQVDLKDRRRHDRGITPLYPADGLPDSVHALRIQLLVQALLCLYESRLILDVQELIHMPDDGKRHVVHHGDVGSAEAIVQIMSALFHR